MLLSRVLIYSLIVAGAVLVVAIDASSDVEIDPYHNEYGLKFTELSWTEMTQQGLLLLSVLLILIFGTRSRERRAISFLLGGLILCALTRELDHHFDRIIFVEWQTVALGVCILMCVAVYRFRDRLVENILELLFVGFNGIFISAFLCVMVFSRLIGLKVIWRSIFEVEVLDLIQRNVKNAVEESAELFGYTLLFIASVEFVLYCRRLPVPDRRIIEIHLDNWRRRLTPGPQDNVRND